MYNNQFLQVFNATFGLLFVPIGLKFACKLCYRYNRDMNIIQEFDTITAISTPLGTGGVGVIRISGEKSFEITERIFTGKITPRMICHGWIVDGDKKVDEHYHLKIQIATPVRM